MGYSVMNCKRAVSEGSLCPRSPIDASMNVVPRQQRVGDGKSEHLLAFET